MSVDLQAAIARTSVWLIHTSQVAFWSMLALSCLVLLLRVLLIHLFATRLATRLPGGRPPAWGRQALVLLIPLSLLTTCRALTPDEVYYASRGRSAMDAGRYAEAIGYYDVLARWGSQRLDVHHNLAVCHLNLGHYAAAIRAFHVAQELPPNDFSMLSHLYCAWAHRQLGDSAAIAGHLAQARALADTPEQRERLAREVDELELEPARP